MDQNKRIGFAHHLQANINVDIDGRGWDSFNPANEDFLKALRIGSENEELRFIKIRISRLGEICWPSNDELIWGQWS
jgi:hypothetical protein